jgi:hypothetical protein
MKPFAFPNALPLAAAALMTFATAGCGRDSVKVYHVDTNDTVTTLPPPANASAMPSSMPAGLPVPDNSGQPPLKYTLPAGWTEKPPTELRVASFGITENGKQVDVSVIPLGGLAGGDTANVNRWRGQVGQKPLADDALAKTAEKVEVAGQPSDLYDIAGTSPGSGDEERIIGTILHQNETAWFFKMSGDGALAEKNKAAFIAFLKSVEFGGLAAPSTMDLSKLPPSHPAIPGMEMAGAQVPAPDAGDKPTWSVPAGWTEGPLAQFLVAKFLIAGSGDTKAEVNVSSLAGDGGGLFPNVNRWRAQLGQPPVSADELAKLPTIDASGTKATVVEISGQNPRNGKAGKLVGVILPLNGQTWFYKLMGDAEVVTAQKDALIKLVQSAKYPAGQ